MSPTTDELVAQAAPIRDDELDALALDPLEAQLRAAIVREPRAAVRRPRRPHRLPRRRVHVAAALAVAVCAALVLAGTSFFGADQVTQRAWAAEAVRVANAVPRLLLDAPGWTVVSADEFSVDFGEMRFTNDGEPGVRLKWNQARPGGLLIDGRKDDPSASMVRTTKVLGHRTLVYRVGDGSMPGDYLAGVWRQGGYVLELRAEAGSVDSLVALLHAIRAVGVDEFLSAMPASVVLPVDRETVVRAMLADLPLPAGFDADRLTAGDAVRDRYQLGARVVGAVACTWIKQWATAKRSGDTATAARAVRAMSSSRDWEILREMQAEGAYPAVLWELADAMAGSGRIMGGRGSTVQESYSQGLGCDTVD
jgi:hypothetical protein